MASASASTPGNVEVKKPGTTASASTPGNGGADQAADAEEDSCDECNSVWQGTYETRCHKCGQSYVTHTGRARSNWARLVKASRLQIVVCAGAAVQEPEDGPVCRYGFGSAPLDFESQAHLVEDFRQRQVEALQRRLQHRLNSVAAIKATPEYKCKELVVEIMDAVPVESAPRTPDPTDFSMSKRQWEASIQRWRSALRVLKVWIDAISVEV